MRTFPQPFPCYHIGCRRCPDDRRMDSTCGVSGLGNLSCLPSHWVCFCSHLTDLTAHHNIEEVRSLFHFTRGKATDGRFGRRISFPYWLRGWRRFGQTPNISNLTTRSTRVSHPADKATWARLTCLSLGLDRLTSLVQQYRDEPSSYSPSAFRECLDSFRTVLFDHLNQEV